MACPAFFSSGGSLEYNPHAGRCTQLQQQISALETADTKRLAAIAWYDRLDIDALSSKFNAAKRECASLEQQHAQAMTELAPAEAEIGRLEVLTGFSFDPRDWFSDQRKKDKQRLEVQRGVQARLRKQLDSINRQLTSNRDLLEDIENERIRYRNFDRLRELAIRASDAVQIANLRSALKQALAAKASVDAKLAEPLAGLAECRRREKQLVGDIARAAELERKLSSASNSYERRLQHDECTKLFGDGSPNKVARQKQGELDGVRRTIDKLDARLRDIAKLATRVVRTVVIDGNNLCYEQQDRSRQMIGLGALEAVVRRLAHQYKIVVVFDAGICSLLKMTSQAVTTRFHGLAQVHIVQSRKGADETILDAASDAGTYVLSNDKFRDFPDKPVVRDRRLVNHSIVNRKIIVHDFDINEHFVAA